MMMMTFGAKCRFRSLTISLGGQHSFGRIKVDSMKVPRFTGSDFNNWRINMEMFLEAAEVWDLVCGEEPEPIVTNGGIVLMGKSLDVEGTEADLKDWRKKNFYACTILYGGHEYRDARGRWLT
jgi:hypothetical protein